MDMDFLNILKLIMMNYSNKFFNLINPLAWFVQNNNAQTMPSLRNSSGADLKVKPMLE